ncbi:hypothetical protein NFI96_023411, partial [Prochilodus magdalenae]
LKEKSTSVHLVSHCDTDSMIIRFPPGQRSDLYLVIDDRPQVLVKSLLLECSHVELQPSSLLRIFYTGCILERWVGQKRPYSVKIYPSESILKRNTIRRKTCPASTPNALLQVPSATRMIPGDLARLEVQLSFPFPPEMENLPAQGKKDLSQEPGLTQRRNEDGLLIKVQNNRMKDRPVVLEYVDLADKPSTAKVTCAQPKQLPGGNVQKDVIPTRPYGHRYGHLRRHPFRKPLDCSDHHTGPCSTRGPHIGYPAGYVEDLPDESFDEFWEFPSIPSELTTPTQGMATTEEQAGDDLLNHTISNHTISNHTISNYTISNYTISNYTISNYRCCIHYTR